MLVRTVWTLVVFCAVGLLQAGTASAQDAEAPNGSGVELPEFPEASVSSAVSPDGTVVFGRSGRSGLGSSTNQSQVLTCLDPRCADVIAVDFGRAFTIDELLFAPSGDLLIVGTDTFRSRILVFRCGREGGTGAYCEGAARESFEVPPAQQDHRYLASYDVTQDRNGRPVALVLATGPASSSRRLELIRCADPACEQVASRSAVTGLDTGYPPAITLDPQDRPFIALSRGDFPGDGDTVLSVIRCGDEACTVPSTSDFTAQTLGLSAGRWEVAGLVSLGPQARPVVALQDRGSPYDLALVDCRDFDCTNPTTAVISRGDAAFAAVDWPNDSFVGVTPSDELLIFGNGKIATCADATCRSGVEIATVAPSRFGAGPRPTLSFNASGGFVALDRGGFVTICDSLDCRFPPVWVGEITATCTEEGDDSNVSVRAYNLSSQRNHVELRTGATVQSAGLTGSYVDLIVADPPEGPVAVVVAVDGTEVASRVVGFACQEEPATRASASCLAGAGRVDVMVVGDPDRIPQTYRVLVGDDERLVTIDESDAIGNGADNPNRFAASVDQIVTFTRRPDGELPVQVIDTESGALVYESSVTVACTPAQVNIALSCLDGNGRIDTTIVERTGAEGTWRLQVGALSPRVRTVAALDWWRSPITGRPEGPIDVEVFRNDVLVERQTLNVACDSAPPVVSEDEIVAISSCRAGLGYVLFQFVNNTAETKPWIIRFEGVPNRSTSALAFGASVRAVSGRPSGNYFVTVNDRVLPLVKVDC